MRIRLSLVSLLKEQRKFVCNSVADITSRNLGEKVDEDNGLYYKGVFGSWNDPSHIATKKLYMVLVAF